jgi:hypothetical protein
MPYGRAFWSRHLRSRSIRDPISDWIASCGILATCITKTCLTVGAEVSWLSIQRGSEERESSTSATSSPIGRRRRPPGTSTHDWILSRALHPSTGLTSCAGSRHGLHCRASGILRTATKPALHFPTRSRNSPSSDFGHTTDSAPARDPASGTEVLGGSVC